MSEIMPDDGGFRRPDEIRPPLIHPWRSEESVEPPLVAVIPEAEPVRPPHPNFWWALLWCFGFLIVTQVVPGIIAVCILMIRFAAAHDLRKLQDADALQRSPEYAEALLPALLLAQISAIAMAWLVVRLVIGKEWPRIIGLRLPSATHLVLALIGLPGLMVIVIGIDGVAKEVLPTFVPLEETMAAFAAWPWPLGVLVIGLGPGIGEELWCRGFLGRGLVGRHGVVAGVLLTSLLFGLIHLEPRQAAYATVMGIMLHLSYLATRSLLVPIILHATNNSFSILSMHIPALQALDVPAGQIPWSVYAVGMLLVGVIGWTLFQSRARLVGHGPGGLQWRPAFPGVEWPPAGAATVVAHPAVGPARWLIVFAGILAFAAAIAQAAL